MKKQTVKQVKVRFTLGAIITILFFAVPFSAFLFVLFVPEGRLAAATASLLFNNRNLVYIFWGGISIGMFFGCIYFAILMRQQYVLQVPEARAYEKAFEQTEFVTVASKMTQVNEYNEMVYHVSFTFPSGKRRSFTPPLISIMLF